MRSTGASDPDPIALTILQTLAAGRLPGIDLLNIELRELLDRGLIEINVGPLPTLTARGRLLLQVANGECAPPLD
jgi:hypothetical protein